MMRKINTRSLVREQKNLTTLKLKEGKKTYEIVSETIF